MVLLHCEKPLSIAHLLAGTFTAGQLTTASEFKKQLLHMVPGAIYSGSSAQLERMLQQQLEKIKEVETVDFMGYSAKHKTYLLEKVAIHEGVVVEANEEDYFQVGRFNVKSLQRSIHMQINKNTAEIDKSWPGHIWAAFGVPGYVALAYWVASLFAGQIREAQLSFPFFGDCGANRAAERQR